MDMNSLLGSGQQQPPSEDFFKMVKLQFDGSAKQIDMITQLREDEIIGLARIQCLNEWCDKKVPMIDIFTNRFMRMKVSQERQGRKEFFDTWKAAGQEQAKASLLGNLFKRQEPIQ